MQEEHLTFIESNILPVFDAPIDNDDDHLESLENKDMNDIINNITNNVCNSSQVLTHSWRIVFWLIIL